MEKLPYNPPEEDFQKANLSEEYLYDLYHDSDPTYTPLQYAQKVIIADRMVRCKPIPVEEKPWERKGFCDNEGYCWVWRTDGIEEYWEFIIATPGLIVVNNSDSDFKYTHCLPHDAIQNPQPKMVEITLTYFKPSGKYYDGTKMEVPVLWHMHNISDEVKELRKNGRLPGLIPSLSHEHYTVLINAENHPNGFPVLINSALLKENDR